MTHTDQLVLLVTAIFLISPAVIIIAIRREIYRADFDVFADEAPTLPGALGGTSPEVELRLVEMFPPWDEDFAQWEAEARRAES